MATLRIAFTNIRLVMRTKAALFFTFVFPLIFLFGYAGIFAHGNPKAVAYFFGPVITLQVMGSAIWGLGLQSVVARERGFLRRYRLAPIGPASMVGSNLLANYLLLIPTVALITICAMVIFHMPLSISLVNLLLLVTIGNFAFAGFGLTVASVANTMQEAQVYNNIVWFPLLFLSGASIPLAMLPHWLQRVAAFLPATYLVSTFQGIMLQAQPLTKHLPELVALLVAGIFGFLFALKLFRWEKEEKISRANKLYSLAFVIPFLLIGIWMNVHPAPMASWGQSFQALDEKPSSPAASAKIGQIPGASAEKPDARRLISDFESGSTASQFGAGWQVSTDSMMGGKSTADMTVVNGGAAGTSKSLQVAGVQVAGGTFMWAGAIFYPASQPFTPANLSANHGIRFWARGEGVEYRLMLFASSNGPMPATQTFVAGPEWKQYSFPFSAFTGIDPSSVQGILFAAPGAPGKFRFQIDQVELW